MLFCTEKYLIFFVIVFTLYWACRWQQLRVWLLLGASFYFYASWNKWLAGIICLSTSLDYAVARGIEACASPRRRKLLLALSLAGNLGLLCYFKYVNFFLRSVEEALQVVGASASLPMLQVI